MRNSFAKFERDLSKLLAYTPIRYPFTKGGAGERLRGQGPVVQSIISLTSSLGGQLVKCFTTL